MALPAEHKEIKDDLMDLNIDHSIKLGILLANPKPGDEVVISGLSGTYPECENVHNLRDNLFNKIDMISSDNRRWEHRNPEIPHRTGKVPNIEKFDAGYFGVHHRQAMFMDPMVRLILEKALEAVFDAGMNPSDLEGTKTGVFIGSTASETEKTLFYDPDYLKPQGYAVTGCTRSMQAKKISYFLKLTGPSFVCDTACSSSLSAFHHAYLAIRTGQCDMAIVGGTNLCLHPNMSLQHARLGVACLDGKCKVFDNAVNGYVRSEAMTAVFLQKLKQAKRNYSTVVHSKTSCDGYKESGLIHPSAEMQKTLYTEFYTECGSVKPTDLSFLEAHGTGTKVGDLEEFRAIEEVFLKGRTTPLLIGSLKSNCGHCEPASGLLSVSKAIIAFETGYVPPNLHYSTPRAGIKSLEDGRLQVVTEKMLLNDDRGLIAISSLGFGGTNSHMLLKQNPKQKVDYGRPIDTIPRLICVSGRTQEAVNILLDDVIENGVDAEHIRLLQEIFRKNVVGHDYRGYSLVAQSGEISRSCNIVDGKKRSLVICFGIVDEGIKKEVTTLLELPLVVNIIQRIHEVLFPKGLNISKIISKTENSTTLESVLGNLTLQIIFADLLKALNIVPDKILGLTKGLTLGSLICAYFDGALSLTEVVRCAYVIGYAANSACIKNSAKSTELADLVGKDEKVAIQLLHALQKILPKPKSLSKKVIFEGTSNEVSSVYLSNCFGSTKVFNNVKTALKTNFTLFEVGNGYISEFLKKELYHVDKKMFVSDKAGLNGLLESLGRLYEVGYNPQIQKLFPDVAFPVSRGTPMISPKIKWNHSRKWWVAHYGLSHVDIKETSSGVALECNKTTYIKGHVIHATGYLVLAWEILAQVHGVKLHDMKVVFENCRFKTAVSVPKEENKVEKLKLIVMVKRSGEFQVIQDGKSVVSGRITQFDNNDDQFTTISTKLTQDLPFMTCKDIYKELRLRGYNYNNRSRALKSCDVTAQAGEIAWDGNWATFMDNMLKMKILQEDARLPYIPITIQRIAIDAKGHMDYVRSFKQEYPNLPVRAFKDISIIRSGFIEITGLSTTSITRRKYMEKPTLEKHIFVPNVTALGIEDAVRVNMQILIENMSSVNITVLELIDEIALKDLQPLSNLVYGALADCPLVQPNVISRKIGPEVKNMKITEINCCLVIGTKMLQNKKVLDCAFETIVDNGFVLSRESVDFDVTSFRLHENTIVTAFTTDQEKHILFRRNSEFKTPVVVNVSSNDKQFSWLPILKSAMKGDGSVLVCSQGEPTNGALGLVASIRKEPGGENVKLIFLPESSTPKFDLKLRFYEDQLKKNLAVNVFKNGHWGTYRYLLLAQGNQIQVDHCYLNSLVRGDLTSLKWLEGPLRFDSIMQPKDNLISVYYTALNFRDVLTASGRLNVDSVTRDRRAQECVQGLEFSGRNQEGRRVMGMVVKGECGSLVKADKELLWDVPDAWSLADAATVPVAYGTCMYALFIRGQMQPGNTVLIHSGTGGIGQAAITLALHAGCAVYTTVSSPEKREFLKKKFSQLTDENIANSRDTTFEKHILKVTNGKGVDIVLNSLAEEKLLASVRCLARGGRFLEIGKFDIANDNKLNLLLFKKEASFHGITLDTLFQDSVAKLDLISMVQNGINTGAIKPLETVVFNMNQQENAFRYMSSGKHMGKVLLQIRQEEEEKMIKPDRLTFPATPRYYCDGNKTYIICGGLGGFGLELADWLVLRGCRKLVLTSRTGIKTGYQTYRISIWRSYSCEVQISTADITTEEGCLNLILEAKKLGPVHAIFNLAVVLKDALLENQTEEHFKISFGPKAYASEHLDFVSRTWCPELRDFVLFSSITSGRGLAGQTNYAMSNSVMERICENRRSDGLPALTIQFAAVGDVGLVADLEDETIVIEGTIQQKIASCLQCLDTFLRQNESVVVSTTVLAEKRTGADSKAVNMVDVVSNILGVTDLKSISLQATFTEVGMESMTAVEIKNTLDREFGLPLTAQGIKSMTFGKLIEIQNKRCAGKQDDYKSETSEKTVSQN